MRRRLGEKEEKEEGLIDGIFRFKCMHDSVNINRRMMRRETD
jgi:hypothetical protein